MEKTYVAPESLKKTATRAFVANVAAVAGLFAGLAIVGSVLEKRKEKTKSPKETQES